MIQLIPFSNYIHQFFGYFTSLIDDMLMIDSAKLLFIYKNISSRHKGARKRIHCVWKVDCPKSVDMAMALAVAMNCECIF